MKQNTSNAVMASRFEPEGSLDDFPTPPWATRALCEYVLPKSSLCGAKVLEPSANRGFMVRPLGEYFGKENVYASDIHDYGCGFDVQNFLDTNYSERQFDWVITNPPFNLAPKFIKKAQGISRIGCAFLLRTAFLESATRWNEIFKESPPSIVAPFTERVPMFKGKVDPKGSTATSYSWFVWTHRAMSDKTTSLMWIPPCKVGLVKSGDYEVAA